MSQAASFTPSPVASPSGSPGDSKPTVVTTYDDKGFTTLVTLYPGTTLAPTAGNRLQNNAAASGVPAAPVVNSGSRLFDGIHLQLLSIILGFIWRQAW
jgi:hypothetical protein